MRRDQASGQGLVADGLLSNVDDARARQFHEGYCANDDEECRKDPARTPADFNKPWEDVPETIRHANRMTADHFEVKLRAVECRIAAKGDGEPARFAPEEMETLARMEHGRWWADRALDGWKFGDPRDNKRKLHPSMVPYEELTERIKQLDRDSVDQMVRILDREGSIVIRDVRQ